MNLPDFILPSINISISAELSNLIVIGGGLLAAIECFFGYRIIRSVISILGFILGAVCGYSITFGFTENLLYAMIGALLFGLLLSIISYKIYLAGVFLISAYGIYSVCMTYLTLDEPLIYLASVGLGLLAGYLAIHYMRPAIIVITAIHGGLTAVTALPLISSIPKGNLFYIGLGLVAAGAVVQFLTTKE